MYITLCGIEPTAAVFVGGSESVRAVENEAVQEDPLKPAEELNIHALTMEDLRREAARILGLYHQASDANEMLALSTRYTKIDMLLDKREKLLAQGVPMSEIIARTTPPPPRSPEPKIEAPVSFETPVDEEEALPEFDHSALPEVSNETSTEAPALSVEVEPATDDVNQVELEPAITEESAAFESEAPILEFNAQEFEAASSESTVPQDATTLEMSVADLANFAPEDFVDESTPLSIPDVDVGFDSNVGSDTEDAPDFSNMPTPIAPQVALTDIVESDIEADIATPVPEIKVNDVDLDTPVPIDGDEAEDDESNPFVISEGDSEQNTTIIIQKKKVKTDFGLGALKKDVGFTDVPSEESEISDSVPEAETNLPEVHDADSELPDVSEEEVPDPESEGFAAVSDASDEPDESPNEEGTESETVAPTAPEDDPEEDDDKPESENDTVIIKKKKFSFFDKPDEEEEVLSPMDSAEAATEDAAEFPTDFDGETTERPFDFSAEDTEGDEEAAALGILTTPFEASDSEMAAFEAAPREEAQDHSEPESTDDAPGDFEAALAGLNDAFEQKAKSGPEAADDSTVEETENAFGEVDHGATDASEAESVPSFGASSGGLPSFAVESIFDIDDDASSTASARSADKEDDSDATFDFEVDTLIPLEETGGKPVGAAAELQTEEESPAPSAENDADDEDVGGIGNLPALGDAISHAGDDEEEDESVPAAKSQEEASTGLPAFEMPAFEFGASDHSSDSLPAFGGSDAKEEEAPPIPAIPSFASLTESDTSSEEQSPAIPPLGGSSAPPAQPAVSSAPTTPAPMMPAPAFPTQAEIDSAREAMKGQDRLCASCGEKTEITEARCIRCYYLDETLGIVNAVMAGDTGLSVKLLRLKPELINIRTKSHNWTLLHMSASGGNLRLSKFLVERGCPVNAQNVYGKTALHYAASKGHAAIIQMLLTAGADRDLKFDNKTALQLAMEHGRSEAIAILQNG